MQNIFDVHLINVCGDVFTSILCVTNFCTEIQSWKKKDVFSFTHHGMGSPKGKGWFIATVNSWLWCIQMVSSRKNYKNYLLSSSFLVRLGVFRALADTIHR